MGELRVISFPSGQFWHLLFARVIIIPDMLCPGPLICPAGGFGACLQNIQEKLLPLNSPGRTILVHTLLRTLGPCLQTESTSVMERIHQGYQDFIGHSRDLEGSYTTRAQLLQPALPLFTALCHWDVQEHKSARAESGNNHKTQKLGFLLSLHLSPSMSWAGFSLSLTMK